MGRARRRQRRPPVTGYRPNVTHPLLKRGSQGDMVVWAQEHLLAAGAELPVTGIFGAPDRAAVRAFQEAHGLPADGAIGTDTWEALLDLHALPAALGRRRGPRARGAAAARHARGDAARSRPRCRPRPTRSRPAP